MITPFIKINIRYKLLRTHKEVREANKNSCFIFLSVVGAYVVRTSSLNNKLLSN